MDIDEDVDTSRPSALFAPTGPRPHTLSIALPTSLLSNSKRKLDLRTHLAGNLSRALAVFNVDEIVLFDDGDLPPSDTHEPHPSSTKLTAFSHPGHFLRFILAYQETPPFMRNRLFPMHENLSQAGLLPSLDIPSHLKANEWCVYREGITVRTSDEGTYVDCGLPRQRLVRDVQIPPKTRVTLSLGDQEADRNGNLADVVSPSTPREHAGYYWGYVMRDAASLSAIFTECPYDGGYDLSIGTSERGDPVTGTVNAVLEQDLKWNHMILVFGGVKGLEEAARNDTELTKMGVGGANVKDLFDHWVNLVPGQGSRTIRTEEAVWIGLTATRQLVEER